MWQARIKTSQAGAILGENSNHRQDSTASLAERIKQAEQSAQGQQGKPPAGHMPAAGIALAGRIALELVAGVVVGGFLGWMLDRWLGTAPGFMLGLFFLGAGAGMMNVWRLVTGRNMKAGFFEEHRDAEKGPDDEGSR